MTTENTPTADDTLDLRTRLRRALAPLEPSEVAMFGGTSFMVADRMVAAARRNGDLLLRIDPAERAELLAKRGAKVARMGPRREMGDGWLAVDGGGLTDDALATWLYAALRHHRRACGRE